MLNWKLWSARCNTWLLASDKGATWFSESNITSGPCNPDGPTMRTTRLSSAATGRPSLTSSRMLSKAVT
ncbi:hypothetical protein D3C79_883910 [compost metagenome]